MGTVVLYLFTLGVGFFFLYYKFSFRCVTFCNVYNAPVYIYKFRIQINVIWDIFFSNDTQPWIFILIKLIIRWYNKIVLLTFSLLYSYSTMYNRCWFWSPLGSCNSIHNYNGLPTCIVMLMPLKRTQNKHRNILDNDQI